MWILLWGGGFGNMSFRSELTLCTHAFGHSTKETALNRSIPHLRPKLCKVLFLRATSQNVGWFLQFQT